MVVVVMQWDRDQLENPLEFKFEEYLTTVARAEREQIAFFAVEKIRFFPQCQERLISRQDYCVEAFDRLLQKKRCRVQHYPRLYSFVTALTIFMVSKHKVQSLFIFLLFYPFFHAFFRRH